MVLQGQLDELQSKFEDTYQSEQLQIEKMKNMVVDHEQKCLLFRQSIIMHQEATNTVIE